MHGNPVNYTDPTGECLFFCSIAVGAIIGGALFGGMYVGYHGIDNGLHGRAWNANMTWEGFGMAVLEGAVMGGIGSGVGYGLGLASKAGWAIGGRGLSWGTALAVDVGAGVLWDTQVRGDSLGTSFAGNIFGSLAGDQFGRAAARNFDTVFGRAFMSAAKTLSDTRVGRSVAGAVRRLDNFERGLWQRHLYAWSQTYSNANSYAVHPLLKLGWDPSKFTIVELGAGNYENAIRLKQEFPHFNVIATNLREHVEMGRRFSMLEGHETVVQMYTGFSSAKNAGVIVGSSRTASPSGLLPHLPIYSPIQNKDLPSKFADVVYTIYPTPSVANSFGSRAARSIRNEGGLIAMTGESNKRFYNFWKGVEGTGLLQSPSPFQLKSMPFGLPGANWERNSWAAYTEMIYIQGQ